MNKINNLKVNFSKVLEDDYSMNKEQIASYWEYREKVEKFEEKRNIAISVAAGEMAGTLGFSIFDVCNGADCLVPVAIASGIGLLTGVVALARKNPYELKQYEEIDEKYESMREDYKKQMKKTKKNK